MKKSILQQMAEGEGRDVAEVVPKSPRHRRMGSPVVGNVGKALTSLSADTVLSLNPDKIDPSPFRDRFETDAEAADALQDLKASIEAEGQKLPVLVRPHPSEEGRYQLAYGHRRTAVLQELHRETDKPETVRVRAYVRELTDAELIREQSLENGVRENLSWIEQALWAVQLKNAGIKQREMEPILGQKETNISVLLKVANAIPDDIVHAIGRAKGVGRPAWVEFSKLFDDQKAADRIRRIVTEPAFLEGDGAERMRLASRAAKGRQKSDATKPAQVEIRSAGKVVGKFKATASSSTMTFPKAEARFARWLTEKLPDLHADFLRQEDDQD
ncbi:plasmid partitioning protein RepB [Roseibium salinum]|uniref:Plasmid partitioning protein RepB n=1 Tax=Roseibium salinum TaxID=1604349 RepID=A0ABT3QVJ6_9HYPH|nr:plasmid partitioning protein RepB [Roseibium sp. DSM 29163]MCX2720940.1 plasmid partitioning protein RepB [Roseibium sp. DSM 29163]